MPTSSIRRTRSGAGSPGRWRCTRSIAAAILSVSLFHGKAEQWGDPHGGGMGSVAVNPVKQHPAAAAQRAGESGGQRHRIGGADTARRKPSRSRRRSTTTRTRLRSKAEPAKRKSTRKRRPRPTNGGPSSTTFPTSFTATWATALSSPMFAAARRRRHRGGQRFSLRQPVRLVCQADCATGWGRTGAPPASIPASATWR